MEGTSDSTVDAQDTGDGDVPGAGDAGAPGTGDTDTSGTADADATCYCPLSGVLDLLSRRYAIQVICAVGAIGPARYGEIEDAFGDVSSSTLSTRLDELVGAGYLSRERYAEIPPRVEYDLTPTGEELCRRLRPLVEWARTQDDR